MSCNLIDLSYLSDFGDARLNKRFNTIVKTFVNHGTAGISARFVDEHPIKSVYRFMSNEKGPFGGIESSEQSRLYQLLAVEKPPVLIHVQETTTVNDSTPKCCKNRPCLN